MSVFDAHWHLNTNKKEKINDTKTNEQNPDGLADVGWNCQRTWSDLYLSTVDLEGAIGSGKVKLAKGDVSKTHKERNRKMSNTTESPANEQPENENATNQTTDKKTVEQQLEEEVRQWQTKIDEVKVQMHLGAMEAKEKAQPYIDQLEQELAKAKKDLQELGQASEGAWQELSKGMRLSFKAIQQSAEKAKEHFEKKEN